MSRSRCATRRGVTPLLVALLFVLVSVLAGCGKKSEDGTVVSDAGPKCAKRAPSAASKGKPTTVEMPKAPVTKLIVDDLRVGTGPAAGKGQQLTVNYLSITCTDGKEFDTSWGRKGKDKDDPLSFVQGSGQVIKGWDAGLLGMKVGGERRLVIPPDLGYGPTGNPPTIPGNETLIFVVELLKVAKAPPPTTTTSPPPTVAPTTGTTAPTTTAAPGSSTTTTAPGSSSTSTTTAGSATTTTTKP